MKSETLVPRRSMSSRRQLVLEMIRRHFRAVGQSPSHTEIGEATGLKRQHVGRLLDELMTAGLLTYQRGRPRSIALVDRTANLSDCELHLACIGRGWTVREPPTQALALTVTYPVDFTRPEDVPEFGLTLIDALKHIE